MNTAVRTFPRVRSLAILAIGAAVHLGFLFQVFTVRSLFGLLFPLVVLTPWLLLLASIYLTAKRTLAQYMPLFAGMAYLPFGAWAFWDTIYVHPDPQGGLVFIVIPVAASIAAVVLVVALLLTRPTSQSPPVARRAS